MQPTVEMIQHYKMPNNNKRTKQLKWWQLSH